MDIVCIGFLEVGKPSFKQSVSNEYGLLLQSPKLMMLIIVYILFLYFLFTLLCFITLRLIFSRCRSFDGRIQEVEIGIGIEILYGYFHGLDKLFISPRVFF